MKPFSDLTTRRDFLGCASALGAASWLASPSAARASGTFPSRPIRIVVGYPPGQTVDSAARAAAAALAANLGQAVVIDNRAGANGIIGAQEVKQAPPDGYTLLLGTSGQLAINPGIYRKLPYDPLKDFDCVMLDGVGRLYLVVPLASPFDSLADLVRYAKANPGKLSYGSGGRGITANLAMEMLKKAAGIDIVHVPYKGSAPALTDLVGGRLDVMMDAGGLMLPQLLSGKLKALGVSSTARYSGLPKVPTIAEQGYPGFQVVAWTAFMAPAHTPPEIVARLNKALIEGQKKPGVMQVAQASGADESGGTPEALRSFLASEVLKWGQAAHDAGVEME